MSNHSNSKINMAALNKKNDLHKFALKLFVTYFKSEQNNSCLEVAFNNDFKSCKQSIL